MHVYAETACEITHKALQRKRRDRGDQDHNDLGQVPCTRQNSTFSTQVTMHNQPDWSTARWSAKRSHQDQVARILKVGEPHKHRHQASLALASYSAKLPRILRSSCSPSSFADRSLTISDCTQMASPASTLSSRECAVTGTPDKSEPLKFDMQDIRSSPPWQHSSSGDDQALLAIYMTKHMLMINLWSKVQTDPLSIRGCIDASV